MSLDETHYLLRKIEGACEAELFRRLNSRPYDPDKMQEKYVRAIKQLNLAANFDENRVDWQAVYDYFATLPELRYVQNLSQHMEVPLSYWDPRWVTVTSQLSSSHEKAAARVYCVIYSDRGGVFIQGHAYVRNKNYTDRMSQFSNFLSTVIRELGQKQQSREILTATPSGIARFMRAHKKAGNPAVLFGMHFGENRHKEVVLESARKQADRFRRDNHPILLESYEQD